MARPGDSRTLTYFHNTSQPNLPPNVVFVEVPYSQGPSFFANLMIYHELGHYVFERLADANDRRLAFTSLLSAMNRAFSEKLGDGIKTPGTRTWAKRVLEAWTKEVFCDLFALRNLGPAFSFALIDFLSLLNLMREDVEGKFDDEHPAPALRLREQQKCLQKGGWWTVVESLPSGHVSLAETTMNPEKRTLLQVRLEDAVESEEIFSTLMGDDVESRRKFIEDNALDVKNLDV